MYPFSIFLRNSYNRFCSIPHPCFIVRLVGQRCLWAHFFYCPTPDNKIDFQLWNSFTNKVIDAVKLCGMVGVYCEGAESL